MNNLCLLLLIVATIYLLSPFCISRGQKKHFMKVSLCCENTVSSRVFLHFGLHLVS